MEAEILESPTPNKTSRMDLKRSNYADAIASQRRELLIQIGGEPPKFVIELGPLKVMDGASVKMACKVV